MTQQLGAKNIVANTNQIFSTPYTGLKGILLDNASPYTLSVQMEGSAISKTLQPDSKDFFEVQSGYNGNIMFSSVVNITNASSYPNYILTVEAVGLNESIDVTQYPVSHPRPAVTATASGQPIFAATFGFGNTASQTQVLNVYNPANSGVNYEFHSARVFSSGNQLGMDTLLQFNSGADNNFITPVPISSHLCTVNPPVSTAHATAIDTLNADIATFNEIEVLDNQQNETLDFLLFPDKVTLSPGNNLMIQYGANTIVNVGTVVRLTMKWTEVPLISTPNNTGGAITPGNILTAANLINQNNGPSTGIITAHPSGDNIPAVFMDNSGNFILGSLLRDADFQMVSASLGGTIFHIRASDNTILFDGAQPFPGDGFTFHSEDGTNQLHVVDSGATFSKQAVLSAGAKFPVGSISQINTITVPVNTTPTAHAHGLTVAPTGYSYIFTGTGTTAGSLQVSSIGATNVTITASGTFTAIITFYAI